MSQTGMLEKDSNSQQFTSGPGEIPFPSGWSVGEKKKKKRKERDYSKNHGNPQKQRRGESEKGPCDVSHSVLGKRKIAGDREP